jgi:quercetin dioxygenase-like cupin family protein
MSQSASVVTTSQGQPRAFLGIRFEVLATGPRSMVTRMLYADGDEAAQHAHPNEQAGYVVSARVRLTIAGETFELGPGDSYVIPADIPHSLTVVSAGEVVDVFTPPREDYL